jgi:hypothetical protein
MSNIFENEKTLGDALFAWYRGALGMDMESFVRFVLPKKLLFELSKMDTFKATASVPEESTAKKSKKKSQ